MININLKMGLFREQTVSPVVSPGHSCKQERKDRLTESGGALHVA